MTDSGTGQLPWRTTGGPTIGTSSIPEPSANGVAERFRAAADAAARDGDVETLPTRLCVAARDALAADGAGLSLLSGGNRVPLGGTDPDVVLVERLQFTAEQGPCWDAIQADSALAVDAAQMIDRWPEFSDELIARTRFRSVASVPVRLGHGLGGALDVHFLDGRAAPHLDLDAASVVADHIAAVLAHTVSRSPSVEGDGLPGPAWARGRAVRDRFATWLAVGVVVHHLAVMPEDALAVLRAAAYADGRTVDELSCEIVADPSALPRLTS